MILLNKFIIQRYIYHYLDHDTSKIRVSILHEINNVYFDGYHKGFNTIDYSPSKYIVVSNNGFYIKNNYTGFGVEFDGYEVRIKKCMLYNIFILSDNKNVGIRRLQEYFLRKFHMIRNPSQTVVDPNELRQYGDFKQYLDVARYCQWNNGHSSVDVIARVDDFGYNFNKRMYELLRNYAPINKYM